MRENLRWRKRLLHLAARDKGLQRDLRAVCAADLLFYVNAFVWTYDPRTAGKVLPWVTFPFQDRVLLRLDKKLELGEDVLIEKARDMGATIMCVIVYEHRWHFLDYQSFLMVSRKEELVDRGPGIRDPKSLFWKIDFVHEYMPGWLLPEGRELGADDPNRTKLHLYNVETGSTIDGESTTGEAGRGDRRTGVLLDEFAAVRDGEDVLKATRDVTRCRFFNSTPSKYGVACAFYEMRESGIEVITLPWTLDPRKSAGLYTDGTGKVRSPAYDREAARVASPAEMAQEWEINYAGSSYLFYGEELVAKHKREYARAPYLVGDLDYNEQTLEPVGFLEGKGPLELWIYPAADGRPPADRMYVIGVDVSEGTGASNTCIVVGDRKTGEKVAQHVTATTRPEQEAPIVVALARWFHGAYVKWEANGPGRPFGSRVLELGYGKVYFRRDEASVSRKMRDIPGWWSTTESKRALLTEHRRALSSGEFIDRSVVSLLEHREYVHVAGGKVEHVRAVKSVDPTGARDNHGDLVVAGALCWSAMKDLGGAGASTEPAASPAVPVGSLAWRRRRRAEEKVRSEFW